MTHETLEIAQKIKSEIIVLNAEIEVLPRTTHKRFLLELDKNKKLDRTYDGKFAVSTGYFDNRIVELLDEDLDLLIALRKQKIEKLEIQLSLLTD